MVLRLVTLTLTSLRIGSDSDYSTQKPGMELDWYRSSDHVTHRAGGTGHYRVTIYFTHLICCVYVALWIESNCPLSGIKLFLLFIHRVRTCSDFIYINFDFIIARDRA